LQFLLRLFKNNYTIDTSFLEPAFETYQNISGSNTFIKNHNRTYYLHCFDYQIYSLDDEMNPRLIYQMDFGKDSAMPHVNQLTMYDAESLVRNNNLVFHLNNFTQLTPSIIYFEYRKGGSGYRCIFDTQNQEHVIYRQFTFQKFSVKTVSSDNEGNVYFILPVSTQEELDLIWEIITENEHIYSNYKTNTGFLPNYIIIKINGRKLGEVV